MMKCTVKDSAVLAISPYVARLPTDMHNCAKNVFIKLINHYVLNVSYIS